MAAEPVYLLDVNVLIALGWPQHVHHGRAQTWFSAEAASSWATTPLTEAGFVRISSNAVLISSAVSVADAVAAIAVMRSLPGHAFLPDDSALADPAIDISRMVTTRQVTDLHLVNLAARAGAVLATLDSAIPSYLAETDRPYIRLLP